VNEQLVSIIVGEYNSALFIEKNVEYLLKQTYQNIEILLYDDASTDGTRQIMKKLENRKKKELSKEKEEHKLKWKTFTPITPILMIVTGTIYLLYTSLMYLS